MDQGHQKDTSKTKIFVGGLPWSTRDEGLYAHFSNYGEIEEAVVLIDRFTGKSKGYGFVTFKRPEDAAKAVEDANPIIDGRRANCNLASLGAKKRNHGQRRNNYQQQNYNNAMMYPGMYAPGMGGMYPAPQMYANMHGYGGQAGAMGFPPQFNAYNAMYPYGDPSQQVGAQGGQPGAQAGQPGQQPPQQGAAPQHGMAMPQGVPAPQPGPGNAAGGAPAHLGGPMFLGGAQQLEMDLAET